MQVGDLVKSHLGNIAIILKVYRLNTGSKEELYVDLIWQSTGYLRTCYQAAVLRKI